MGNLYRTDVGTSKSIPVIPKDGLMFSGKTYTAASGSRDHGGSNTTTISMNYYQPISIDVTLLNRRGYGSARLTVNSSSIYIEVGGDPKTFNFTSEDGTLNISFITSAAMGDNREVGSFDYFINVKNYKEKFKEN